MTKSGRLKDYLQVIFLIVEFNIRSISDRIRIIEPHSYSPKRQTVIAFDTKDKEVTISAEKVVGIKNRIYFAKG